MLELKIPPPAVALLTAAGMWALARQGGTFFIPPAARYVLVALIASVGGGISLSGILAFRRAQTTINPLHPEKASALVTTRIYGCTRNPMYLGLTVVLTAWAVFLKSRWAFAGPAVFALYINRFQIVPEERILRRLFAEAYPVYANKVRRWF